MKSLEERLTEWNIPYAVVVDLETGHAIRVGYSTGMGFEDLESNLFGDTEMVFETERSLNGQTLPRIWSQGRISCFVCRPNEKTIVGLFCNDQRNPVENYHWSKQLNSQVVNAFART